MKNTDQKYGLQITERGVAPDHDFGTDICAAFVRLISYGIQIAIAIAAILILSMEESSAGIVCSKTGFFDDTCRVERYVNHKIIHFNYKTCPNGCTKKLPPRVGTYRSNLPECPIVARYVHTVWNGRIYAMHGSSTVYHTCGGL